jgi:regulatory protein
VTRPNPGKKYTLSQIKEKILRYCVYQERCHAEVREKLFRLGLTGQQADELITFLITEGYLNEERFARMYSGGKFRLKRWGRVRITKSLENKGLSLNCIRAGLQEIEEEEYLATLKNILGTKSSALEESDLFVKRDKVAKFAIQRGFEANLVWEVTLELLPDRQSG